MSPAAGVYFPGARARGGAERLCLVLALDLVGLGYDVTFFTEGPVDLGELEADLGEPLRSLRFEQLPRREYPERLPTALRRLAVDLADVRHLRSHDLDLFVNGHYKSRVPGVARRNILYCHFPYPLEERVHGRLRGRYVRAVQSVHRRVVARDPGGFLATYDEVWANSAFTAHHVAEMWGRTARVLHPPCPMHPPGVKQPVILSVGRFQAPQGQAPYKAQDRLIEAFARLAELHPTWQLELAGGTTDRPEDVAYLARLGRLASDLPVTLRPDCTYEELAEAYARASLYWHAQGLGADLRTSPVSAEHFGISTVEAMSAGALPLVFDAGGPAEVVEPLADATWRSVDELLDLTRVWAGRTEAERTRAAQAAALRAGDFDRGSFRLRLAHLVRK